MKKITMPRTKIGLLYLLKSAYKCGCNDGYGFEHTVSLQEQEELGYRRFIGEITDEEFFKKLEELLDA